ncbi:type II toxin-antitoxin system RelE/ParE family toxin [Candidatus Wolfebacteria bacterium]|nr:type II toxin-antitoxin system RelE/ParE family toxin [Candidatus Wolfebacteria bacterium]
MNSSKSWGLQIDPGVFKLLNKIPHRDAEALLQAIKLLPINPYFGDIRKMQGMEDTWRRRISSYRIYYKIKTAESVILVFHIERRTSKTY